MHHQESCNIQIVNITRGSGAKPAKKNIPNFQLKIKICIGKFSENIVFFLRLTNFGPIFDRFVARSVRGLKSSAWPGPALSEPARFNL